MVTMHFNRHTPALAVADSKHAPNSIEPVNHSLRQQGCVGRPDVRSVAAQPLTVVRNRPRPMVARPQTFSASTTASRIVPWLVDPAAEQGNQLREPALHVVAV